MRGHCRFLRTKGGASYFAQVEVEVQPVGQELEIVYSLPEQVDFGEGEVNWETARSWVEAGLEGARDALTFARDAGVLRAGCRVELVKVVGTPADTREDVVRCAAGLAAVQGLGCPELTAEARLDGNQWTLHFSYPSAAQRSVPPQPARWTIRAPAQKPEWQAHDGSVR